MVTILLRETQLKRLIVISGQVSSGKSTLAEGLVRNFGFDIQRTKDWLKRRNRTGREPGRRDLQRIGDGLDVRTHGRWVVDELTKQLPLLKTGTVVVDSARTKDQIEELREAFGPIVTHIHLTATQAGLRRRFAERKKQKRQELATYEAVRRNKTEQHVDSLKAIADIVINTERCTEKDLLIRAASHLRLYDANSTGYVDVLIGGQYGSEGKGQIASYISREYDLLVRVGGSNAGHKVFALPEPYTHHLLPSGTTRSRAKLLLGPGAVIDLETLLKEISKYGVDSERLKIDRKATMVLAEDKKNEGGLKKTMGSTAQGVGYATARRITNRIPPGAPLARDVPELKPFLCDAVDVLAEALSKNQRVLLEGTQGTGLSLYHGEYPYVTSRDTTVSGCLAGAGIPPSHVRKVIMVCRTYPIRVGDPGGGYSGPMSQEITKQEIARRSGKSLEEISKTEITSTTNRPRKFGEFDWALLRKAALLNGPTDIALTFVDYLSVDNANARRFEQLHQETISFIHEVERVSGARVSLIATGFNTRSIIDRRSW
jgi:adenylosuccinate synthase